MREMKYIYHSCAALALGGGFSAVHAEDVAVHAEDAAVADSDTATSSDIVVTAERRTASVQSTPIAISVVSGDEMLAQNKSGSDEILRELPGVTISRAPAGSFISIRGISSIQGGGEIDPGLAFSVDGVYNPFSESAFLAFYDVDRIEVLKGPQGTLYGRNAIAGAVNVITKSPTFDAVSGFVQGNIGNYDTRGLTGALNVPLSSTLAMRIAGDYKYNSGYLNNGSDDADVISGRGKLLWEPSASARIELRGDYAKFSGQGNAPAHYPFESDPWTAFDTPSEPFQDISLWGVSAQADFDLGPVTLTYIPAYKKKRNDTKTDLGGTFVSSYVYDKQDTQELRLSSNSSSPLSWIFGAYYFHGINDTGLTFAATIRQHVVTTSYAAFGQATYSLTDAFRLTGGLRYTSDRKVEDGTNSVGDTLVSEIEDIQFEWNKWNWRAGFEYDVAPESMLYGSISTGYKAGGTSLVAGPNAFFDPEELVAYEIGLKNKLFDNSLILNGSAYYYDYSNYQAAFTAANPDFGGAMTRRVANAGDAKIYGGEIEAQFRPTRNDRLAATVAYFHGRFGDFIVPTPVAGVNNDYSHSKLSNPAWTATASYGHDIHFDNGGVLSPEVSLRFNGAGYRDGRQYATAGSWGSAGTYVTPLSYQDSFVKGDIYLAYTTPEGRFRVTAYVKNVTDKAVFTSVASNPTTSYAFLEPPRTFGMTFNYNW